MEEVVEDGTTVQTKQDGAEENKEGGVGGGFAGWHVFYGNGGVCALVLVLPLVIAGALVVLVAIFVLVLGAATVLMDWTGGLS